MSEPMQIEQRKAVREAVAFRFPHAAVHELSAALSDSEVAVSPPAGKTFAFMWPDEEFVNLSFSKLQKSMSQPGVKEQEEPIQQDQSNGNNDVQNVVGQEQDQQEGSTSLENKLQELGISFDELAKKIYQKISSDLVTALSQQGVVLREFEEVIKQIYEV